MHLRAARYDAGGGHSSGQLNGFQGSRSAFNRLLPINQSGGPTSKSRRVIADTTSQLGGSEADARAKQLQGQQLKLMDLVETCASLAAAAGASSQLSQEALAKAQEAQQVFDELRSSVQNLQTSAKSDGEQSASIARRLRAPHLMGLFELELMVISNLARQLELAGFPNKALDLYSKLCKMAPPINDAGSGSGNSSTRQQLSAYRFGINAGNLHHHLGDHQRALRLYRLTFDRISGQAGFAGLKLKLSSNIALTLVAMGQLDEATIAWQRLLTDNQDQSSFEASGLRFQPSSTTEAAATKTTTTTLISATQGRRDSQQQSGGDAGLPSSCCWPKNTNHHNKFGINHSLCLYLRCDSAGLLSALKSLAKLNICRHFERVYNLIEEKSLVQQLSLTGEQTPGEYDNSPEQLNHELAATPTGRPVRVGQIGKSLPAAVYAGLLRNARDPVRLQSSSLLQEEGQSLESIAIADQTQKQKQNQTKLEMLGNAARGGSTATQLAASKQQVAVAAGPDAGLKQQQQQRDSDGESSKSGGSSLVGLRNLLQVKRNWLANTAASKRKQQKQQHQHIELASSHKQAVMQAIAADELERMLDESEKQLHWALLVSASLLIDLDGNKSDKSRDDTTAAGKLATPRYSRGQLGAYRICMQIFEASPLAEWMKVALVSDIKSSLAAKLLQRQVVTSFAWQRNFHEAGKLIRQLDLGRQSPPGGASSMAWSNSSLAAILAAELRRAHGLASKAVQSDKQNVAAWINLANCHYLLREFELSEAANKQALELNPNSWLARYNLALCQRKLVGNSTTTTTVVTADASPALETGGHKQGQQLQQLQQLQHLQQQQQQINRLAVDRTFASLLISKGMILSLVQLALIHLQTGNKLECKAILSDLLESSRKQAPEVHLLASKVNAQAGSLAVGAAADQNALGLLQQAYREHPYHLQLAERLIALSINSFNYALARETLNDCINNRPDQVKWYRMLAECHRRAADYDKAMTIYRKTIELFPRDVGCLKSLITLSEELGLEEETTAYKLKLEQLANKRDTSLM